MKYVFFAFFILFLSSCKKENYKICNFEKKLIENVEHIQIVVSKSKISNNYYVEVVDENNKFFKQKFYICNKISIKSDDNDKSYVSGKLYEILKNEYELETNLFIDIESIKSE